MSDFFSILLINLFVFPSETKNLVAQRFSIHFSNSWHVLISTKRKMAKKLRRYCMCGTYYGRRKEQTFLLERIHRHDKNIFSKDYKTFLRAFELVQTCPTYTANTQPLMLNSAYAINRSAPQSYGMGDKKLNLNIISLKSKRIIFILFYVQFSHFFGKYKMKSNRTTTHCIYHLYMH